MERHRFFVLTARRQNFECFYGQRNQFLDILRIIPFSDCGQLFVKDLQYVCHRRTSIRARSCKGIERGAMAAIALTYLEWRLWKIKTGEKTSEKHMKDSKGVSYHDDWKRWSAAFQTVLSSFYFTCYLQPHPHFHMMWCIFSVSPIDQSPVFQSHATWKPHPLIKSRALDSLLMPLRLGNLRYLSRLPATVHWPPIRLSWWRN